MSLSNFINSIRIEEYANLHYGRMVRRDLKFRERLLDHWRDLRHPHAEHFAEHEAEVRHIL
jgi:hypothetical protein